MTFDILVTMLCLPSRTRSPTVFDVDRLLFSVIIQVVSGNYIGGKQKTNYITYTVISNYIDRKSRAYEK